MSDTNSGHLGSRGMRIALATWPLGHDTIVTIVMMARHYDLHFLAVALLLVAAPCESTTSFIGHGRVKCTDDTLLRAIQDVRAHAQTMQRRKSSAHRRLSPCKRRDAIRNSSISLLLSVVRIVIITSLQRVEDSSSVLRQNFASGFSVELVFTFVAPRPQD
jgi:hypothetical protein